VADDQTKSRRIGYKSPPLHPPTEFQPGQSGNPAGRPPNEGSITYWLKKLLAEPNGGGLPVAKAVAQKVIAQAKKGDLKAISEVLDRTEGKAAQTIRGEEGRPVPISLIEVVKPSADE